MGDGFGHFGLRRVLAEYFLHRREFLPAFLLASLPDGFLPVL
jgi:hypothetical protein